MLATGGPGNLSGQDSEILKIFIIKYLNLTNHMYTGYSKLGALLNLSGHIVFITVTKYFFCVD